jgi:high affinity Mn2+ porin
MRALKTEGWRPVIAWRRLGRILVAASLMIVCSLSFQRALAQLPDVTSRQKPGPQGPDESPTTMFPHLPDGRFWFSGQMNVIDQAHPPFSASYSGPNSFQTPAQNAAGQVTTLYTGMQFTKSSEVLLDFEAAAGLGLSGALGIAGFTNLDAVRDATLSNAPYLSRVMYHQVFALGREKTDGNRGPLSTFNKLPVRRVEMRVGRFGMTDFFDTNAVGSDSHLQFLNWSIDQNGAYDFTGDARGYTWGVLTEYQSPKWGARFSEALMPGPQNGGPLVWNLRKANTSNAEVELHHGVLRKKDGVIRLLGYLNHANMGVYHAANEQYLQGLSTQPNIGDHPFRVTSKSGLGINLEQAVMENVTLYARFGWNDGKTESWSFTEIDHTVSSGVGVLGRLWKRNNDRTGIAFALNGISREHARYLELGGLGFVLGDSGLQYAKEKEAEVYYTAHVWRGLFLGPDLQYVVDLGYNKSRGPVIVPSFRVHTEF